MSYISATTSLALRRYFQKLEMLSCQYLPDVRLWIFYYTRVSLITTVQLRPSSICGNNFVKFGFNFLVLRMSMLRFVFISIYPFLVDISCYPR